MAWKGKTVFLTGASSGIGEALAVALARRGAILGLLARREDLLTQIAARCESAGGTARIFACDVVDSDSVHLAAAKFRAEFGRIDIMIANAGISGKDAVTQSYDPESVKKVIDVNFIGSVVSIHSVLADMIEYGSGHLVAISSLAGVRGLPKSAAYSSSKAAMTTFFESVRLDHIKHGIDVTIIQPGFIETPLTAGRKNKMPFLMKLDDGIPYFISAIEKKKKFAAFPWQLAAVVWLGKLMPAWLYDNVAGRARYRE